MWESKKLVSVHCGRCIVSFIHGKVRCKLDYNDNINPFNPDRPLVKPYNPGSPGPQSENLKVFYFLPKINPHIDKSVKILKTEVFFLQIHTFCKSFHLQTHYVKPGGKWMSAPLLPFGVIVSPTRASTLDAQVLFTLWATIHCLGEVIRIVFARHRWVGSRKPFAFEIRFFAGMTPSSSDNAWSSTFCSRNFAIR